MRDREGIVQSAAREGYGPVKPEPPEDLWEQVDKLVAAAPHRPPNSFTLREYMERKGHATRHAAQRELKPLVDAGKVKTVRVDRSVYYVLV